MTQYLVDPLSNTAFNDSDNAPVILKSGTAYTRASINKIVSEHAGVCPVTKQKITDKEIAFAALSTPTSTKISQVHLHLLTRLDRNQKELQKQYEAIQAWFAKSRDGLRKEAAEIVDRLAAGGKEEAANYEADKLDETTILFDCKTQYYDILAGKAAKELDKANEKLLYDYLGTNEQLELFEKKINNMSAKVNLDFKDLDSRLTEIKAINAASALPEGADDDLKKIFNNLKSNLQDLLTLSKNSVKTRGINTVNDGVKRFNDLKAKLKEKQAQFIALEEAKAAGDKDADTKLAQAKPELEAIRAQVKKFIEEIDDEVRLLAEKIEKDKKRILSLTDKFMAIVKPGAYKGSGTKNEELNELKKQLEALARQVDDEKKGSAAMASSSKQALDQLSKEKDSQIKDLEEKLKEESEKREETEKQLEETKTELEEKTKKNEELTEELKKTSEQLEEKKKEVETLTEEKKKLEEEVKEKKEKIEQLEQKVSEQSTEIDRLKSELAEKEARIQQLTKDLESTTTERDTIKGELDKLHGEHQDLHEQKKKLHEEHEQVKGELVETKKAHEQAKTELVETQKAHEQTKSELVETQKAHEQTKTELVETKTQHEQTKTELKESVTAHEATKTELKTVAEQHEVVKTKNQKLRDSIKEKNAALQNLINNNEEDI